MHRSYFSLGLFFALATTCAVLFRDYAVSAVYGLYRASRAVFDFAFPAAEAVTRTLNGLPSLVETNARVTSSAGAATESFLTHRIARLSSARRGSGAPCTSLGFAASA